MTWPIPVPGEKKAILIVEDEPDMADVLRVCLIGDRRISAALDVWVLPTAKEAFEILEADAPQWRIAVVLLDINLETPGIGYAVLNACQTRKPPVPVVMLSGRPTASEDEEFAYRAGVLRFIQKPPDPAVLQAYIKRNFVPQAEGLPLGEGYYFDALAQVIVDSLGNRVTHAVESLQVIGVLLQAPKRTVTKDEFDAAGWPAPNEQAELMVNAQTRYKRVQRLNDLLERHGIPVRIKGYGDGRNLTHYKLIDVPGANSNSTESEDRD